MREAPDNLMNLVSVKRCAFDVELLVAARLLKLSIVQLSIKIHLNGLFSARQVPGMLVGLLGITYMLGAIHWYQGKLDNPQVVYNPGIKW